MNHTTNYNLPQWEDTDRVTREDINGAMSVIDAALSGTAKVAAGRYNGNSTYNNQTTQTFTLGFHPKAVLVVQSGRFFSSHTALFTRDYTITYGESKLGKITDDGFQVGSGYDGSGNDASTSLNSNSLFYTYLAIG